VTGLDLDPAMIDRARANADRPGNSDQHRPSFVVGDVATLPFPDGSFDLVVSTLSMYHWADPTAGLAEIGRVLRPSSRALIWDFRPGVRPIRSDHATPPARSRRPRARRSASSGERRTMALALEIHPHPRPSTTAQVKDAAEGRVVGRREVTCSAVSGKFLARTLHARLLHERQRHRSAAWAASDWHLGALPLSSTWYG
jgi:ubiquinone/menaquinone biosynthesis C-methylase UbiE